MRVVTRAVAGAAARALLLVATACLLPACATPGALERARDEFRGGDAGVALATLAEAEVADRDRLLLLLDRGLVAHAAGRFRESTRAFAEADALLERLDRVSVSEQGAALVVNDRVTSYRGESAERLWINTFQMLNYLALGEPEGAAVEARRALLDLDEHAEALAGDQVTRLLIAMSFEAAGQFEAASVEYRRLVASPDVAPGILRAAWLNARRTARPDEAERLARRLPAATLADARAELDERAGELVLVTATGFVPPKRSGDLFLSTDLRIAFPYYAERFDASPPSLEVRVGGRTLRPGLVTTRLVDVARVALAERGKRIAARQTARAAAKYNIAHSVSREDAFAGEIVRLILFVLEQADTRGWETLPATLSIAQVRLPPGEHEVEVTVRDGPVVRRALLPGVEVRAGHRTFRSLRPGTGGRETVADGAALHYAARPD